MLLGREKEVSMSLIRGLVTRTAAIAAIGVMVSALAQAQATNWKIDTNHSSADFSVQNQGSNVVNGRFTKVSGTVAWDDSDVTKSQVQATIDAGSIDTGIAKRDEDLRTTSFFDVARYPTITFKSTSVSGGGNDVMVNGDLTMHGVTNAVTLKVSDIKNKDSKKGKTRSFKATTKLKRSDFHVGAAAGTIADDITITLDIKLE